MAALLLAEAYTVFLLEERRDPSYWRMLDCLQASAYVSLGHSITYFRRLNSLIE